MFETIDLTVDDRGVATLLLNRPEKHNAMSGEMIAELAQAAAQLHADVSVRVVVLTGAGRSFCAGGDLAWMRAQMQAAPTERAASARALAEMLGALNTLRKPLIGRVQGNAFGGGVGLCSVCDKVFAVDTAKFGLTETRLGLIPATIGPYVVARMGGGPARQVFMSSRPFGAKQARELGVVSAISDTQGIDIEVEKEIMAYLECAPTAIAEAKQMALVLGGAPDETAIAASIDALLARWAHPEAEQGISAFFDKTVPPWAT